MYRQGTRRILTIVDALSLGGIERAAVNYTLGYRTAGCEVAVLAILEGGPREATLLQEGVPVFLGGTDPQAQDRALADALRWRPTVIHIHGQGPPSSASARAVESLKEARPQTPVLETTSFGKPDYAQTYTATDISLLMTRWGMWRWSRWTRNLRPPPLGVIVPITVDTAAFRPLPPAARREIRRGLGVPEGAVLFGCIARPDPVKWPSITFRAFKRVASRYPAAHFLVAGLTSQARLRVEKWPAWLRDRVTEIPVIEGDEALCACYNAMDVFLHGSTIGETFGLVFIEALACETPVLTVSKPAKNNGHLEVVGHGRGGLIANNLSALSREMERLIQDPQLRRQLGKQGAAHVRSSYTLDQVVPLLLRIIDHVEQSADRRALAAALEADPLLTTSAADDEIDDLMTNTSGRIPATQRMLKRVGHVPWIYKQWQRIAR